VARHSGIFDSRRETSPQLLDPVFYSKNRAFLTHPRGDATYSARAKISTEQRAIGSPLLQRIVRVSTDVHNNKDMGP
jgi:hypothetical protein